MPSGYVPQNVFVELGLSNLPDEKKVLMLSQMNTVVEKRLMLRVMDVLPSDVATQLDQAGLSDEQKMEKIVENVPQLADLIAEEVELVKQEMKAASVVNKE